MGIFKIRVTTVINMTIIIFYNDSEIGHRHTLPEPFINSFHSSYIITSITNLPLSFTTFANLFIFIDCKFIFLS